MNEPLLSAADARVWDRWRMTFDMHARTASFRRAVVQAQRVAEEALSTAKAPVVALSGGKDSTVMTHLIAQSFGPYLPVVSEKDDLDYPGEEEYVRGLADAWKLDLTIVRPPVSPMQWLLQRRGSLSAGEDMHSREAGLSKACFYGVMEKANEGHDIVFMGLRAEESMARRKNRKTRGLTYVLKTGQRRSTPLGDWTGLDVLTYLQVHQIDPLPVYRCCALLPEHRERPWLIRKSWWIPGEHAKHGGVAWLRWYWPSLYTKLKSLTYDTGSYC
jgi:3'-phosphoadenosine 5'-phosphosulfate sulfotransferase (PAPS reductase)/FAD synthetase